MVRAREVAESHPGEDVVVVADYQTAGRGTNGREWIAPPSTCLMFTTSSPSRISPDQLQLLPGMVARAVSETIRTTCGVQTTVKPPNDVVTRNGKLCGVLCASKLQMRRIEWVSCGVGLNTVMRRDQLPTPFSTSLALETQTVPDHLTLLQKLLDNLEFIRSDDPVNLLPSGVQRSC